LAPTPGTNATADTIVDVLAAAVAAGIDLTDGCEWAAQIYMRPQASYAQVSAAGLQVFHGSLEMAAAETGLLATPAFTAQAGIGTPTSTLYPITQYESNTNHTVSSGIVPLSPAGSFEVRTTYTYSPPNQPAALSALVYIHGFWRL